MQVEEQFRLAEMFEVSQTVATQTINGKPVKQPKPGRQPNPNKDKFMELYEKVLVGDMKAAEAQRQLGISKQTYYNWAKECDIEVKPVTELQSLNMSLREFPVGDLHSVGHVWERAHVELSSSLTRIMVKKITDVFSEDLLQKQYDWFLKYSNTLLSAKTCVPGEVFVLTILIQNFLKQTNSYYEKALEQEKLHKSQNAQLS